MDNEMIKMTDSELVEFFQMDSEEIKKFRTFKSDAKAKIWLKARVDAYENNINRICPRCGTCCYGDCEA